MICKKSENLDKKQKERNLKSLEQSLEKSLEIPVIMMMKGEMYKKKLEQKKQEKALHETDGCSFMPQVNKKPKKL